MISYSKKFTQQWVVFFGSRTVVTQNCYTQYLPYKAFKQELRYRYYGTFVTDICFIHTLHGHLLQTYITVLMLQYICYRLLLNTNFTRTFVTDLYYSTHVTVLMLQTFVSVHILQDTYFDHLFFTIKIAFLIYDLHLKNVLSQF